MKLTDDIVRALNGCIEEGYESVSDFARLANVSANTITKYLRKETESIKDETWQKIYPLIKGYLAGRQGKSSSSHGRPMELSSDEKILLDAFNELSPAVQRQKLLEIVELARRQIETNA